MRKFSIVLMVLMFSAAVSGAVVEDLQVGENFESSFTGGDTVSASGSFVNAEESTDEFAAVLEVSAEDMTVSGREFSNVSFSLNQNLSDCEDSIQQEASAVYRCGLSSTVEEGENDFLVEAETVPYLKPGNYSFDLELKSVIGVEAEKVSASLNASEPQNFELEDLEVSVNASENATAEIQSFEDLSVPLPEGEDLFVGGASVGVLSEDAEVPATGEVSFSYSDDPEVSESSLNVYFYNESTQSWNEVESDVGSGSVTAEVESFSTYAAFAEEDDEDSGGGSSTTISDFGDSQQQNDSEDQQDETQEQGDQTEGSEESDQDEESTEEQQEGSQEQDSDSQQDNQESPDQGITGQFLGSPTNVGGLLIGLLVAMVAALQYFGKIELRSLMELVREKLGKIR